MVKKVFKYPVDIHDVVRIQMPRGAEILSVGNQNDIFCIWALCDDRCPLEERTFRIAGTGHAINYDMCIEYIFLGTVHLYSSRLICHVFEVLQSATLKLAKGDNMTKWRVPSIDELITLIDYSRWNPATPEGCPIDSCHYWSSTTFADNPNYAWDVSFVNGYVNISSKAYNIYVQCVRGELSLNSYRGERFKELPDGILDKKTGLVWRKNAPTEVMTWREAMDYAEMLNKED